MKLLALLAFVGIAPVFIATLACRPSDTDASVENIQRIALHAKIDASAWAGKSRCDIAMVPFIETGKINRELGFAVYRGVVGSFLGSNWPAEKRVRYGEEVSDALAAHGIFPNSLLQRESAIAASSILECKGLLIGEAFYSDSEMTLEYRTFDASGGQFGELETVRFDIKTDPIRIFILMRPPLPTTEPSESGRPAICYNRSLRAAIEIIDSACSDAGCDYSVLRQLDTKIDRKSLMTALRDRRLIQTNLFYPVSETRVSAAFDWTILKREQLAAVALTSQVDPSNSVLYVLARTTKSSSVDQDLDLSYKRAVGAIGYLKDILHFRPSNIKIGLLGAEALQLSLDDAEILGIPTEEYRGDLNTLNQSVHIFAFPCADLLQDPH